MNPTFQQKRILNVRSLQASRAEDDLEVGFAVVADRISWAAVLGLIRVGPALRRVAVVRVALLVRAVVGCVLRVHGKTDVAFATLHEGEVVGSAVKFAHLAVAELGQGLSLPLSASAPLGVAREAKANVLVGGSDGLGVVGGDGDGLRALNHLEAAADLVEAKVLGRRALVADFDVESVIRALHQARGAAVDWNSCCRQGEQRTEEPACGVHFVVMTVWVS